MKTKLSNASLAFWLISLLAVITLAKLATAQPPTPQERVAALKTSLAVSQELLKQYEWLETTVVSVKGEGNQQLWTAATMARTEGSKRFPSL